MSKFQIANKLLIVITLFVFSCSKSSPPSPSPPAEARLTFTINPDPGTTVFSALGASQDFNIIVTSALPAAGINVTISAVKELDGSSVFSQSLSSNLTNFTSTIQNLQNGVVCNVTITLTSRSSSANTVSRTFKLARK